MRKIPVHPPGTQVWVDRKKGYIGVVYPKGTKPAHGWTDLRTDWVKKYLTCRVCKKKLTDALLARAFWRHEELTCSTKCAQDELLKRHACCKKAKPLSCVCTYATTCPIHGQRHSGTHE